jgi:hypothetical protein
MDQIELNVNYTLLITHFRVLDYKVYILIEKERRVQSRKLVTRVKVGILMGYKGAHIY